MAVKEITGSGYPTPDSSYYTKFTKPQCTWYAHGRMKEIGGKTITFSEDYGLNAKVWPNYVTNCSETNASADPPPSHSVAVFNGVDSNGHVAFVYGMQGGTVMFSDSNYGRDNTKVYGCSLTEFKALCGGLICYLK